MLDINIDALFGQVTNMAKATSYGVIFAKILLDGFGLGRTLNDNKVLWA